MELIWSRSCHSESTTDILLSPEWERRQGAKVGRSVSERACLLLNSGDCRNSSPFLPSPPSGLNICAFLFITGDSLPARPRPLSLSPDLSPPFAFHRLITNCTCSLTPKVQRFRTPGGKIPVPLPPSLSPSNAQQVLARNRSEARFGNRFETIMTPPRGERQYSPIHTPSPAAAGDGQNGEEEGEKTRPR